MLRSLKESHRVACVAKSEIEEGIKARTRAAPRSPLAAPALLEPIAEAVESGDAALVRKLLETFNGNIDAACDRHGSTLLHYAHMGGHPEVARSSRRRGRPRTCATPKASGLRTTPRLCGNPGRRSMSRFS